MGTSGTAGVLNGRGASGAVFLRMITPIQTSTNASSVPMLTSWLSTPIGVSAEAEAIIVPVSIVLRCGVRNLGWTAENIGGSRRSRLIE